MRLLYSLAMSARKLQWWKKDISISMEHGMIKLSLQESFFSVTFTWKHDYITLTCKSPTAQEETV